jgi:hypothetical protein
MNRIFVVSLVGWLLTPLGAQTPASGSIQGQVVRALTGAPIPGAIVTLRGPFDKPVLLVRPNNAALTPTPAPAQTASDGQGNFRFSNLASGNYELAPRHNGYVPAPGTRPGVAVELFPVAAGQQVSGVVLKLEPVAVVTGKVLDAAGEPVQGALITLIRRTYTVPGRPDYTRFNAMRTDDHGIYWTTGAAGTYSLKIDPPAALVEQKDPSGQVYTTTYYPDSIDPAAMATFDVAMGATRSVDIQLHRRAAFRISGRAIGPDGLGRSYGSLQLLRDDGATATAIGTALRSSFDGNFEIAGVPAGSYLLAASYIPDQSFFARQPIQVSGNMDDVRLQLHSAHEIRGSVRVEGKAAGDLNGSSVELCALDHAEPVRTTPLNTDFTFSFPGITQGHYAVCVTHLPAAYYVKSVQYDGRELPATGLDAAVGAGLSIVVSAVGAARLVGKVLDASGKPAPYALVTLFPLNGAAMSAVNAYSDGDGTFAFPAVRPGPYKAMAWEDNGNALLLQSGGVELLKSLNAGSAAVRLRAGGKQTIQLHWVSAREKERIFAAH